MKMHELNETRSKLIDAETKLSDKNVLEIEFRKIREILDLKMKEVDDLSDN